MNRTIKFIKELKAWLLTTRHGGFNDLSRQRDADKDIRKGMADVEAGRVEDYEDILN